MRLRQNERQTIAESRGMEARGDTGLANIQEGLRVYRRILGGGEARTIAYPLTRLLGHNSTTYAVGNSCKNIGYR